MAHHHHHHRPRRGFRGGGWGWGPWASWYPFALASMQQQSVNQHRQQRQPEQAAMRLQRELYRMGLHDVLEVTPAGPRRLMVLFAGHPDNHVVPSYWEGMRVLTATAG